MKAFGISEDLNYNTNSRYAYKSAGIFFGLYMFFFVEQIMHFCMQYKRVSNFF